MNAHCVRRCFLHNSSFSVLILSFSSFSQFWGSGATPNHCLWCFGGLRTSHRWFGWQKCILKNLKKSWKNDPSFTQRSAHVNTYFEDSGEETMYFDTVLNSLAWPYLNFSSFNMVWTELRNYSSKYCIVAKARNFYICP